MATTVLTASSAFTRTNATQADQSTPVSIPTLSDTTPTAVVQLELLLPAAGSSVTLPVPSSWTLVVQVQVTNIDTTGFIALTLNGTSGAPNITLQPQGGTFASSFYGTGLSGGVAANPAVWTLKSMSADGTTIGAAATNVYIYLAGH